MGFPAAGQRRRPFGPTNSGLGCTTGNRHEFVLFCCASSRTGRRVRVRSGRRVTGSQQRAPAGPCGPRPQTCPSLPTGEPSGSPRPPRAKPGGSGTDKGCPSPALPCSRIISLPGGFPAPLPISQALLLPWRALPPPPAPLLCILHSPARLPGVLRGPHLWSI